MHMDENSGTYLSNIQHFALPQRSRLLTPQNERFQDFKIVLF